MQALPDGAGERHRDREAVEKYSNDNWYTMGTDGTPAGCRYDYCTAHCVRVKSTLALC